MVRITGLRCFACGSHRSLSRASFRPASNMAYSTVHRTVSLYGHAFQVRVLFYFVL